MCSSLPWPRGQEHLWSLQWQVLRWPCGWQDVKIWSLANYCGDKHSVVRFEKIKDCCWWIVRPDCVLMRTRRKGWMTFLKLFSATLRLSVDRQRGNSRLFNHHVSCRHHWGTCQWSVRRFASHFWLWLAGWSWKCGWMCGSGVCVCRSVCAGHVVLVCLCWSVCTGHVVLVCVCRSVCAGCVHLVCVCQSVCAGHVVLVCVCWPVCAVHVVLVCMCWTVCAGCVVLVCVCWSICAGCVLLVCLDWVSAFVVDGMKLLPFSYSPTGLWQWNSVFTIVCLQTASWSWERHIDWSPDLHLVTPKWVTAPHLVQPASRDLCRNIASEWLSWMQGWLLL